MKILLFVLQALLFVTSAHSADHEYLNPKSNQEPWRQAFLAMFDDEIFYKETLVPLFLSQGQEYELLYLTDHIKSSWGKKTIEELNLNDKALWNEVLTFCTKHFPMKRKESKLANKRIAQGFGSLKRMRFQESARGGFVKPPLKKSRTDMVGSTIKTNRQHPKEGWGSLFLLSFGAKIQRYEINLKEWELDSIKDKIKETQAIYKGELKGKEKHRLMDKSQTEVLKELIGALNRAFRKIQSMERENRVHDILTNNVKEVAGLLTRMARRVEDSQQMKKALKVILGKKYNMKKSTASFTKAIFTDPKNGELALARLWELQKKEPIAFK